MAVHGFVNSVDERVTDFLSADDFHDIVLQEPSIAFVLFRVLAQRLRDLDETEALSLVP